MAKRTIGRSFMAFYTEVSLLGPSKEVADLAGILSEAQLLGVPDICETRKVFLNMYDTYY